MTNYPIIVKIVIGFIVALQLQLSLADGDFNRQNDWMLRMVPFVQIEEDGGFTIKF